MRNIELSKITADSRNRFNDSDEDVPATETTPVTINVDAIRCFYPRKEGRPGTRITFTDGGGFAVTESYAAIRDLLTATVH